MPSKGCVCWPNKPARLKSTPQQTVTRVPKTSVSSTTAAATTTSASTPVASSGVIKIEPANPQVVYVPNYNPRDSLWRLAQYRLSAGVLTAPSGTAICR
ncbi:membrane protein [Salmonella bongori]|nr:membrane protein [Salmonella bongori]